MEIKDKENGAKFVMHIPCEECQSKDNAALYSDNSTYCFGCEAYGHGDDSIRVPAQKLNSALLPGTYSALKARGITEATCRKFDYQVGMDGTRPVQIANYQDENGQVVAQKIRDQDKNFKILGDGKSVGLFGQHLWSGGRMIIVAEGEIDTLSISQAQGNKFPIVGLPLGAQGGKKALLKAWDYLLQYESIVLVFDQDEAGRKAALDCAEALPVGRVKIAKLPMKDANECLKAGLEKEIINAVFRAKDWRPDGIISSDSLLEEMKKPTPGIDVSYPFPKLNEMTRGIRTGLVTICAGTGTGKSTFIKEIAYHLHMSGHPCGMLMFEESNAITMKSMVGIHLDKNIVTDSWRATEDEIEAAYYDFRGDSEVHLFEDGGVTAVDIVVNRIQYMVKCLGCKYIFLDPISVLVASATGQVADERRFIDQVTITLRNLVQELDICLFIVSHLKRPSGKGHEDGGKVSLSEIRGSSGIAMLSDQCIGLNRSEETPSDDSREIWLLKNRFTGEVGPADNLMYFRETGRLLVNDTPDRF